jgi:putative hydrolase of the HAD superfamily
MIKKICIDWGNTICALTGEYSGPMIDWPEIQLFPGAKNALAQLRENFDLNIATNAKESTTDQINAVMERVECSDYFSHIFTPAEIGFGKEKVNYYHRIAQQSNCAPNEILMIGDDYELDVRNAWEAGWQTAYFNSNFFEPHGMYLPLHQFEVSSWDEFLIALGTPRPTLQEAISWYQGENASYVLLQHVQTVAAIAYWFAVRLRERKMMVDPILTHRAGLLHDLDKLTPNRPPGDHGEAGATMLREKGFARVAEIVASHVIKTPDKIKLESMEAKLVFFADKLVKHNEIVSIKERYDDLEARYPKNSAYRNEVEPYSNEIQDQLCKLIRIDPQNLLPQIKADLMGSKPD